MGDLLDLLRTGDVNKIQTTLSGKELHELKRVNVEAAAKILKSHPDKADAFKRFLITGDQPKWFAQALKWLDLSYFQTITADEAKDLTIDELTMPTKKHYTDAVEYLGSNPQRQAVVDAITPKIPGANNISSTKGNQQYNWFTKALETMPAVETDAPNPEAIESDNAQKTESQNQDESPTKKTSEKENASTLQDLASESQPERGAPPPSLLQNLVSAPGPQPEKGEQQNPDSMTMAQKREFFKKQSEKTHGSIRPVDFDEMKQRGRKARRQTVTTENVDVSATTGNLMGALQRKCGQFIKSSETAVDEKTEPNKFSESHLRRLAHLDEYEHSSPVALALFLIIFFIIGVVWLRFTRSTREPKKRCRKATANDAQLRNSPELSC